MICTYGDVLHFTTIGFPPEVVELWNPFKAGISSPRFCQRDTGDLGMKTLEVGSHN
jgi:hypothetical protein